MNPQDILSQLVEAYLYNGGCQIYPDETENEYVNDFEDEEEMYEDD